MKTSFFEYFCVCALIWTSFVLFSCGPRAPAAPAVPTTHPQEQPATRAEKAEEDANHRINRLEGELKQAHLDRDAARDAKIQERVAWVRLILIWLTGLCAIAAVLLGGAAVYFRSKAAIGLVVVCLVMIVIAQATNLMLDHIKVAVGCGVGLIAVVGAYFLLTGKHLRGALKQVIQVAENLKPDEETDEVARLRKEMQAKLVSGYEKTVDQLRKELGHL